MKLEESPAIKKAKVEEEEEEDEDEGEEEEEALVALIQHRTEEVHALRQKLSHYQSQLEAAEKKLSEHQSKLIRLRSYRHGLGHGDVNLKEGRLASSGPAPPAQTSASCRTQLVIPSMNATARPATTSSAIPNKPPSQIAVATLTKRPPFSAPSVDKSRRELLENGRRPPNPEPSGDKNPKRKLEHKEHKDLIPSVRRSVTPNLLRFQPGNHISSQHKRKLRCLLLNPVEDYMFATSALDGVVNLWQVQAKGTSASLLSTTDCISPKRRWPEDITWHPDGDSLFASYHADNGDSQVSILNLNTTGAKRVHFLEEKPHIRGIINAILFMPWDDSCFATAGSDHAVILWHKNGLSWKAKALHRNQHSSAVMGIAGLQQKKIIISVGADKRIVVFDVLASRSEFMHQVDSKCMSVLSNPSDFNLFMVQTGAHGKQLRLFDIRLKKTELHAFGWQQESSESQSALVNQAWSPDGWYISSGSADPMIHIFDIRYNSQSPSQSVQAHQKRVFKAAWHQSFPMLTSISSDLNIGFHKYT